MLKIYQILKNKFNKNILVFFGVLIFFFFFLHILFIGAFYLSLYLSGTVFRSKIGLNLPSQNRCSKSPKTRKNRKIT